MLNNTLRLRGLQVVSRVEVMANCHAEPFGFAQDRLREASQLGRSGSACRTVTLRFFASLRMTECRIVHFLRLLRVPGRARRPAPPAVIMDAYLRDTTLQGVSKIEIVAICHAEPFGFAQDRLREASPLGRSGSVYRTVTSRFFASLRMTECRIPHF